MSAEAHVTCLGQQGKAAELEPRLSDTGFRFVHDKIVLVEAP